MTETKKTCRYCGCEGTRKELSREGLAQCRSWSCKDALACGERLRQQTAEADIVSGGFDTHEMDNDLPF